MIVIIAEKPSLARNIAAAIGNLRRREGYLEGEGYLVTWAFGHLFSLCDVEHYTGAAPGKRWTAADLPCFPERFDFELRAGKDKKPDDGVRRQFETIRSLLFREDVEKIVNAGDADREGEIIVRSILAQSGVKNKPVYRLWLPDQTPETVREGLQNLKPDSDYDRLAGEGYARTYIDWLYGVNLTRYATLKTGTLLRVGRVIVPIVKAIYDRDLAIENFQPETYFGVTAHLGEGENAVELVSKKKFSRDEEKAAIEWARRLSAERAVVKEKKEKKDALSPGKLFSLSKLQNLLGKKYKMPMEQSLKIVQDLYEKGFLTYPRTNSEYLATAEKDKIRAVLGKVRALGYPVAFFDKKTIFDDSKIESHSALTPTTRLPDKNALTPDEMRVYQTVFRRFVSVFCAEACVCKKSEITVAVGDLEEFTLKGTVILEKGWTRFEEPGKGEKILPDLKKGDPIELAFAPKEKETSPPKHYTIETLNNYLKNPFREEKKNAEEAETDDREEYRAMFEGLELGTEATRTGIIENAIKSEYIALKKDVYSILPGGRFLIEQLGYMDILMDKYKTATVGKALKSVFHGEMTVEEAVALTRAEVSEVFRREPPSPEQDRDTGFYGDVVGVCPLCGGEVTKGRYAYRCAGYRTGCAFRIPLVIASRPVPLSAARQLLRENKAGTLAGFVSRRTGKTFDAALVLQDSAVKFDFQNK